MRKIKFIRPRRDEDPKPPESKLSKFWRYTAPVSTVVTSIAVAVIAFLQLVETSHQRKLELARTLNRYTASVTYRSANGGVETMPGLGAPLVPYQISLGLLRGESEIVNVLAVQRMALHAGRFKNVARSDFDGCEVFVMGLVDAPVGNKLEVTLDPGANSLFDHMAYRAPNGQVVIMDSLETEISVSYYDIFSEKKRDVISVYGTDFTVERNVGESTMDPLPIVLFSPNEAIPFHALTDSDLGKCEGLVNAARLS